MNQPQSNYYLGIKCVVLFSYYSLLHHFGLGIEFKFWSFLLLTPIVKYFYFNKLSTLPDAQIFFFSVLNDSLFGILYYQYFIYWESLWLVIFPFLAIFWILCAEYLQYLFLGSKDETYVIKVSKNPTDFLLLPVIVSTYIFVGLFLPSNLAISPWTFIFWIMSVIFIDGSFGIIHYLSHIYPALRKLHMVHHEYRKEDLNSVATFYADILDSFLTNFPNIIFSIMTVWLSVNPIVIKEAILNSLFIHHKYPNNQMTLMYYFEFDLIDMIMNRTRLSYYHHVNSSTFREKLCFLGIYFG